jgi:hypothetical protein
MPIEIPTNRLDYVSPRFWTRFVEEALLPADFMGTDFLPFQDEAADRIYAEIGKYARPMAPFSDVDAEAPEINIGKTITSVWFDALQIKLKGRLKASDLRWLRLYGDRPAVDPAGLMASAAKRTITNMMKSLNDAVDTRIEWLQMNSLLGRLTVVGDASSPVAFDIQYPVTTYTASPLWSDTGNADPFLDIWNWTKDAYLQGVTYKTLIAPRPVLYNLAINAKLRAMMAAPTIGYTPSTVTPNQIRDLFMTRFGIDVREYHAVYTTRTDDGTTTTDTAGKIIPDNKVILLPDQPVGYTGTVPQELKNWQTGKYTWRNEPDNNPGMQDPPRHEMGVGWGGMPVILWPNRIIVATVA